MDTSFWLDTIILVINLQKQYCILLSERSFLPLFTISVDPDEMLHATFHLGLHCLQKYLFRDFQNTNRGYVIQFVNMGCVQK